MCGLTAIGKFVILLCLCVGLIGNLSRPAHAFDLTRCTRHFADAPQRQLAQQTTRIALLPRHSQNNLCWLNTATQIRDLSEHVPDLDLSKATVIYFLAPEAGLPGLSTRMNVPVDWDFHVVLEYEGAIYDLEDADVSGIRRLGDYVHHMFQFKSKQEQMEFNWFERVPMSGTETLGHLSFRRIPALEYLELIRDQSNGATANSLAGRHTDPTLEARFPRQRLREWGPEIQLRVYQADRPSSQPFPNVQLRKGSPFKIEQMPGTEEPLALTTSQPAQITGANQGKNDSMMFDLGMRRFSSNHRETSPQAPEALAMRKLLIQEARKDPGLRALLNHRP